jgi:hypothetical protein
MSTASMKSPEPAHHYIVRRTVEACNLTKEAAAAAAEGIATGSSALLNSLRQRERELDTLDAEIDNSVTTAITEVAPAEAEGRGVQNRLRIAEFGLNCTECTENLS